MGLLSWFRGGQSKELTNDISNVSNPANWLITSLGGGPTAAGKRVGLANSLTCSAVFACAKVLSEDVAKLPLEIYQRRSDGGREVAKQHFLYRLLRRPNHWMNRFQFIEFLMFCLVMRGNAIIVILRDGRGRPKKLIPVSPDRVTILEAYDGTLFYQISRQGQHQVAALEDVPLAVPEDDILHIRTLSADGLVGLSPIAQAREAIAQSLVLEEHGSRLFGSGARPGGVLRVKTKLSPEVAARMKASWEAAHGGVGKTGGTAVLEEDTDWKPLGMTSVDAQFLDTRRFQIEEIARMFRVPLHKLNSLERSTNNNIAHQGLEYLTDALSPYLKRIEEAFEFKFELDFGREEYFLEFDTYHLVRTDLETRYKAYAVAKNNGWMSTNEIRIKEGLNPVPDGDQLMEPLNMVPIGTDRTKLQNQGQSGDSGSPRENVKDE